MKQIIDVKRKSELILILWAGSAALLSYSLVYALRKPYTAASFEGLSLMGIDYKVAVTTIQILGYVIAKFFGIKIISELKKENRFRFFVGSAVLAEISLLLFGMFDAPFNAFAMFLNGLSLGCMWGIIFSFIEGRKITDILASLLGVSMVFSSGLSKSVGLFVINDLGIDQFWMPAIIGGVALPLLVLVVMDVCTRRYSRNTDCIGNTRSLHVLQEQYTCTAVAHIYSCCGMSGDDLCIVQLCCS